MDNGRGGAGFVCRSCVWVGGTNRLFGSSVIRFIVLGPLWLKDTKMFVGLENKSVISYWDPFGAIYRMSK